MINFAKAKVWHKSLIIGNSRDCEQIIPKTQMNCEIFSLLVQKIYVVASKESIEKSV